MKHLPLSQPMTPCIQTTYNLQSYHTIPNIETNYWFLVVSGKGRQVTPPSRLYNCVERLLVAAAHVECGADICMSNFLESRLCIVGMPEG